MQLLDLLISRAIYIPWPTVVHSKEVSFKELDGQAMQKSPICTKRCGASPQCVSQPTTKLENVCSHGMTFFRGQIGITSVTIFGVRGVENPSSQVPHLKVALKGRTVTQEEFRNWLGTLTNLLNAIELEFTNRQSEMLDPLHDPIRLANHIRSIAYGLVHADLEGANVYDQVDRASPEMKTLVKTADLLTDAFDLLTIYFNPTAASFGRKTYISIYGLMRKLVYILRSRGMEENNEEPKSVYLSGECHRSVLVYESFKLIPLALISNAIKYSLTGGVRVDILDRAGKIEVSVESIGPLIEPDEMKAIFEKRGRGKWAQKVATGSGVGLYLAKVVGEANGIAIHVASTKQGGKDIKGVPIAKNRFWFEITSSGA